MTSSGNIKETNCLQVIVQSISYDFVFRGQKWETHDPQTIAAVIAAEEIVAEPKKPSIHYQKF